MKAGEHAELGRKSSIASSGPVVWICAEETADSAGMFQSVLSIKAFGAPHSILPAIGWCCTRSSEEINSSEGLSKEEAVGWPCI